MTPLVNQKYDLVKMEKLVQKYADFSWQDKWNQIGNHFDTTGHAAYMWYWRNKPQDSQGPSSDTWRLVYQLIAGPNAQAKFTRGKVETIKKEIMRMILES